MDGTFKDVESALHGAIARGLLHGLGCSACTHLVMPCSDPSFCVDQECDKIEFQVCQDHALLYPAAPQICRSRLDDELWHGRQASYNSCQVFIICGCVSFVFSAQQGLPAVQSNHGSRQKPSRHANLQKGATHDERNH
jgi:hypothetical protein